ncbi:MAG: protein-export chaperone SecB [Spirochaetaceae bacterium]|jgi:preprotein translocase subunit SecB|nr:protein-export chaperone SecB [Spirochaetaceae bacterium]
MPSGGVAAQFNFVSYKIDSINLKMNPTVKYLLKNEPIALKDIDFSIKLRSTEKFNINGSIKYVGGLTTKITIMDEEDKKEILSGEFGISGIFAPDGAVDQSSEENFSKISLPALLMPYLRALMANILSQTGFGTVLFPLVNIYELAKKKNLPLIDHTQS